MNEPASPISNGFNKRTQSLSSLSQHTQAELASILKKPSHKLENVSYSECKVFRILGPRYLTRREKTLSVKLCLLAWPTVQYPSLYKTRMRVFQLHRKSLKTVNLCTRFLSKRLRIPECNRPLRKTQWCRARRCRKVALSKPQRCRALSQADSFRSEHSKIVENYFKFNN